MAKELNVAYGQFIVRWRWPVLILSLMIALYAASGMKGLFFSSDYRIFFGPDNPQLAAQDELERTYTKVDMASFVLKPAEGDVFNPEMLGLVQELTERLWQVPYAIRVDSITNFQNTYAEEDDLIVGDLVEDPLSLSTEELTRIRDIALHEPTLVKRLIAVDGKTTQVMVTVETPNAESETIKRIVGPIREIAAEMREKYPDVRIGLSGNVMMSMAFAEAAEGDMVHLFPVMFLLLALSILLFLRSFMGMLSSMSVVFLAVFSGIGMAGHLGWGLNSASVNSFVIILTISVADSIHLLITYFLHLRRGEDRREATVETLRINMQPVFLTSLTTVIGFLSLNFNDSPPFRDLGNISAIGVAAAWFYSITFLPALLAILPMKPLGKGHFEENLIARYVEWVIAHKGRILVATSATVILLASFIPRIEYNDKFVEFFSKNVEFRQDSDFLMDNLTGAYTIEFSVPSGEDGGISDPAYLAKLEEFSNWLQDQPEVIHVLSFTHVIKRLNMNMNGDDPGYYALPESRNMAAQYTLLFEMSLPYGLDLNNQIDVAKSSTRVTAILDNINSGQMKEVKFRAQDWFEDHAPKAMQPSGGTSVNLIFAFLTKRTFDSMFWGTGIAFFIISACLVIALRSLRLGLVSLVPNIAPAIVAFGIWAVLVGEIGIFAASVTATALGLIVDCTVHFLSKYLRGRREKGMNAEDAVRYSFSMVGSALWISSLVLIAGFSSLMFSNFSMNSKMGMLTALVIAVALVIDFLLLPALLLYVDKDENRYGALQKDV